MLLKSQWLSDEVKEETRKYLGTNENGKYTPKPMVCSKSSSKMEIYTITGLPQETRKISNKHTNLPPKGIRKKQTKPKVAGGKQ